MDLSENIKLLRKKAGLSQVTVAEKLGMTSQNYSLLENGKTELTHSKMQKLSEILGVSVGELLGIAGTLPVGEEGQVEAMKREIERLQNKLREVSSEKNLILFGVRSFLLVSKMLVGSEVSIEELKETLKKTTEAFSEELEKIKPKGEPPTDTNLPEGWQK